MNFLRNLSPTSGTTSSSSSSSGTGKTKPICPLLSTEPVLSPNNEVAIFGLGWELVLKRKTINLLQCICLLDTAILSNAVRDIECMNRHFNLLWFFLFGLYNARTHPSSSRWLLSLIGNFSDDSGALSHGSSPSEVWNVALWAMLAVRSRIQPTIESKIIQKQCSWSTIHQRYRTKSFYLNLGGCIRQHRKVGVRSIVVLYGIPAKIRRRKLNSTWRILPYQQRSGFTQNWSPWMGQNFTKQKNIINTILKRLRASEANNDWEDMVNQMR